MPAPVRRCAHPGCETKLYQGNTNGVCRRHNHGSACRCAHCIETKYRPPVPAMQPGLKPTGPVPVIRVRYVGGGSTSVSCGEGEEYARSMVETMAMGREIASLEVVK